MSSGGSGLRVLVAQTRLTRRDTLEDRHCPTLCHVPPRGQARIFGLRGPGPGPVPTNVGWVKERGLPGLPVPSEDQISQPALGPSSSYHRQRERLPNLSTGTRAAAFMGL